MMVGVTGADTVLDMEAAAGQGPGDEAVVDTRIGLGKDTMEGVGTAGGGTDMGGAVDSENSMARGEGRVREI